MRDPLLAFFRVVVGLIGVASGVYGLLQPNHRVGIGVLLAVVVCALVWVKFERRLVQWFTDRFPRRAVKGRHPSANWIGRFASSDTNSNILYSIIRCQIFVAPPSVYEHVTERGVYVARGGEPPITQVVRHIAADVSFEDSQIHAAAWISVARRDRQPATVLVRAEEGKHAYVLTIRLRGERIRPGEEFTLDWEYQIPGCVPGREDYWVFGLSRAEYQIGSLELIGNFNRRLARLSVLDNERREFSCTGPTSRKDERGQIWEVYESQIHQPTAPHYAFEWTLPENPVAVETGTFSGAS